MQQPMQQLALFFSIICSVFLTDVKALELESTFPDQDKKSSFNHESALKYSQNAIGKILNHYALEDSKGKIISLNEFRGKPLVISLIYTSCYHICSMTTQHLAKVVQVARNVLGADSFTVATIGFDTRYDTSQRMHEFANKQGIKIAHWYFLSTNAETIQALAQNLGFTFFASPRGYDHIIQATIIDAEGQIYQQVYGEIFDVPLLVEPLKQLILGRSNSEIPFLTDLVNRVRFFCTTYDPSSNAYHFDYSIFLGFFIGASIIFSTVFFLIREFLRGRNHHTNL